MAPSSSTSKGLHERAIEAADAIRAEMPRAAKLALVLGSGLGDQAYRLSSPVSIPYARIPHFPLPTVEGHQGNLLGGGVGGVDVFVLQGRFHYYEGWSLEEVTFPIRVLRTLGVRTLILTAAVGGIAPELDAGSIVCVDDHLNLLGVNPLRGPNEEAFGARFPDMTEVYGRELRRLAQLEAEQLGFALSSGVYACLPGPSYETPAEIRMLRTLGADVVGMSTVPEAIVARHAGMSVLAFALVTNAAAGTAEGAINHTEVLEMGRAAAPRLGALIEGVVRRIGSDLD